MIGETDEGRLVALIDNQLDETARRAMQARLAAEPDLLALYHRLAAGGLPFRRAFDDALAEAPVARIQASLDALDGDARRPRRRWIGAAAAALVLLGAGWAAGRYAPPGPAAPLASADQSDWRAAVANYVSLYTSETFAGGDGGAHEAAELAHLSQDLGVELTPERIALPDLTFKWANMLGYDGAPLGQIAYLDADKPVVFCIIRKGEKDAPIAAESREGLAIAAWTRGGRGFLVGGRISEQRALQLAGTLAARF